jgi:2-keto-3-deoxy-galactonokinase
MVVDGEVRVGDEGEVMVVSAAQLIERLRHEVLVSPAGAERDVARARLVQWEEREERIMVSPGMLQERQMLEDLRHGEEMEMCTAHFS